MGWLDWIEDLTDYTPIGWASNAVNDIIDHFTGKDKQDQYRAEDKQEQRDLMDKQLEQEKDFAAYQNQLQQQTWMQQFSTQNQYNDPSQVVQRYLGAGINPSAAFQGSTVGQSTAQIAASPVSGGSLPNAKPVASSMDYANSANNQFSTVAQALASLASAYKGTAEGTVIAETMADQVKQMKMSTEMQDIALQGAKLYSVPKMRQEWLNLCQQGNFLMKQAENADLQGLVLIEERANKIADRAYTIAQTESQKILNNNYSELLKSTINENRARAYEAYKHGDLASSQKIGQDFLNTISKIDSENAVATAQDKLDALRQEYFKNSSLSKTERARAEAEFEKLDKLLKMYRNHPSKAAADATLDNFNEHFPIIGGFIKAFSK